MESNLAEAAARNLDRASFLAARPPRHRTAILVRVEGGTLREAGKRVPAAGTIVSADYDPVTQLFKVKAETSYANSIGTFGTDAAMTYRFAPGTQLKFQSRLQHEAQKSLAMPRHAEWVVSGPRP